MRHFAVLSNRWELQPARWIEWDCEKAGTIEFVIPNRGDRGIPGNSDSRQLRTEISRQNSAHGKKPEIPRVAAISKHFCCTLVELWMFPWTMWCNSGSNSTPTIRWKGYGPWHFVSTIQRESWKVKKRWRHFSSLR